MSSSQIYNNLIQEALKKKNDVTADSINKLEIMYSQLAKDLKKELRKGNVKGGFSKAWTSDYIKFLEFKSQELYSMQMDIITGAIKEGARISASVNGDFYSYINGKYELNIPKEFLDYAYNIDDDVLALILNGGFYKDNRSLSDRIWKNVNGSMEDIQYILMKGIAGGKSYLDIIKDLEAHVNPAAKKPWDFRKVYPGIRSRKIDYNAQRLLRTSVTQMFQLESNRKAKENPYITRGRWNLSSQHYSRQVKHFGEDECDRYAGKLFHLSKIPLQHPQCLCYITYEIPKSLDEIGTELREWLDGKENKKLDRWAGIKTETPKAPKTPKNNISRDIFKECKDIKEGTSYAKKLLGVDKVSYSGLDIDSVNEYNRGIFKALESFPQLKNFINNIKTNSSRNSYASMGYSGTPVRGDDGNFYYKLEKSLKISKILNKNLNIYNNQIKSDMKSDFHTERTSKMHGTMAHELMHAVEIMLLEKKYAVDDSMIPLNEMKKFSSDFRKGNMANEIVNKVMDNLNITDDDKKYEAVKELGKYAMSNKSELIAEAMSDYVGSDEPLEFSKEVIKVIKELLKGE